MSDPLLEALSNWLGPARVDAKKIDRYRSIFTFVTGSDPHSQADVTASWPEFVAAADGLARHTTKPPRAPICDLVPSVARSRDRATGLRHGSMCPPVDVNSADVEELARVPGIGRVLAREIVAARTTRGAFKSLGDVAALAPYAVGQWQKAAAHLRLGALPRRVSYRPPTVFKQYIELCASTGSPSDVCLSELERLAEFAYWPSDRRLGEHEQRRRRSGQAAMAWLDSALQADVPTSFLTGSDFLRVVAKLARGSSTRIACVIPVLRTGGQAVRTALLALSGAVARGVSVRLLVRAKGNVDARYTLTAAGCDVRLWAGDASLHESLVLVDTIHVVSGSHNWSPSSAYRNEELSTYTRSAELATAAWQRFEEAWSASPQGDGP
ncbi:MAG: helix-hairpin-helix domain-containing protein [Deltaproteobacteria bacterium]|nr:helix-hairpin-helix domain-containing protein [Deltaproteobacteria bacterium]